MANKANVAHLQEEDTIDLLELAKVVLKNIWIILICLTIGFAAGGIYTKTQIPTKYQAASMIYVYTKTTSVTSLADLQIGAQLTVDFQIIAETREVVDKVNEELQLGMSYEDLVKKVKVDNPSQSRILKVVVTDIDPVRAANISNSFASQLRQRIAEVMDTDAPSIVSKAVVPVNPVGPSVARNALVAGLACAALAAAVIIVRYLLDDTIKSESDIERYLGQNVIAVMPMVPSLAKAKK